MGELFGTLDVATRALLVNGRGLATTSHNIANANTPGYSRQRQVLSAAPAAVTSIGSLGTGVEESSIQRINDEFIQRQLVQARASSGSLDAQAKTLAQVEAVLNEQQAGGISDELSQLYRAFEDLASSPTPGAPVERSSLRAAAQSLIDTIHRADLQLRDLQRSTDRSIVAMLPEINAIADRIAQVNEAIVRQEAIAPANDLRDEREQLVRDLAEKIEVTTFEQENGNFVVMIAGGVPIVDGTRSASLVEVADTSNPFDPTYSQVYFQDGANFFDLTSEIGGGELGGLLLARDTITASAIRSLDTLAYNLVETVNAVHVQGRGLDGLDGRNFFTSLTQVEDAARDIALDASILSSTDNIAAGGASGTGGASDNRNALLLAALRDSRVPLSLPGDPPGPASGPTSSVLEFAGSMLADIGQQARTAEAGRVVQERLLQEIENRREEVSGVSIDEEVTHLIRLQASFQANARVVQTIGRLLDDVLAIL